MMGTVGTPAGVLNVLVIANTGKANAALTKTRAAFRLTGVQAQSSAAASSAAWGKAGAAAALGAGVVAAASAKMAIDFDRAMRNVNSIAQLNEKTFQKTSKGVLSIAKETAQAPVTIAEGIYDLVSSGFAAKESLGIVEQSAKAATAGLTDTAVSTKAVAAVLNAYRLPAENAKKVSDTLFKTVDRGVITFEDLAQNIGDTLPFAATLGVRIGEVGAATATMTKQGLSASETMTRIRNVLQTLIKPGVALTNTLDKMNMSGSELIKKKGLQGALDALVATTDGSKEAVGKLFPNIRALGGAFALTGKQSGRAKQDLKAFADVSGATNTALKEQAKSVSFQWNQAKAEIQATAIEFGNTLLPIVTVGIGVLADFGHVAIDVTRALTEMPPELAMIAGAGLAAAGALKLIAVVLPAIISVASGLIAIPGIIGAIATSGAIAATSMTALSLAFAASPFLTVAAGAAALTGAFFGVKAIVGALFGEEEKLGGMQTNLKRTSENLEVALVAQKTALGSLARQADRVKEAHAKERRATEGVHKAEVHLKNIRAQYPKNAKPVIRAEAELTEAKKKEHRATRQLDRAERQTGVMRETTKKILKETLGAERQRILTLQELRDRQFETLKTMNRYGATAEELNGQQKKLDGTTRKLTEARKEESNTLREASEKIGKNFVKRLDEMSVSQLQFGRKTISVTKVLDNPFKSSIINLENPMKRIITASERLGDSYVETQRVGSSAINKLNTDTQKAADSLGINVPAFGTTAEKGGKKNKKRAGGTLIGGVGSGDKVHLMAEPGEVVWNREAVKQMGGPQQANRANKIYKRQQGGIIGLAKGGEVTQMQAMQQMANKFESATEPYLLGGGHGGFLTSPAPVDCSGFVSAVLHAAGLLEGAPMVSGALMSWGKPGSGPLTVYANDGHTFMSLGGQYYGTSRSNPGGGAGLIEGGYDSGYLSGFTRRTVDATGKAGMVAGAGIPRQIITGPAGPMRDTAQAVADKIYKGASGMLQKKMPSGSFGGGDTQLPGKGGTYTASWYGPTPSTTGASGEDLVGTQSFAELGINGGIGNALGDLPFHKQIGVTYNGATVQVEKLDVGSGGPGLGGNIRAVDLWQDAARRLPGFMAAGLGNVDVTGLKKGGIIEQFSNQWSNAEGAEEKREALSSVGKKIKAIEVRAGARDKMRKMRQQIDIWGEWASNAAGLSQSVDIDIPGAATGTTPEALLAGISVINPFTGNAMTMPEMLRGIGDQEIAAGDTVSMDIPGMFRNGTEADWLTKQLQHLWDYRKKLIDAFKQAKKFRDQMDDIIKDAKEKLQDVRDSITAKEKKRKELGKDLFKAQDNKEKSKKLIEARLADELKKKPKDRDEDYIAELRTALKEKSSEKQALRQAIDKIDAKIIERGKFRDALADRVMPGATAQRQKLNTSVGGFKTELDTVQGAGLPAKKIKNLPPLGTLGGEIYTAQEALQSLIGKLPTIRTDDTSADGLDGWTISRLREFSQAVQFGSFANSPYFGSFATGGTAAMSSAKSGWALVGERGPELAQFPSGTTFKPSGATQQMFNPTIDFQPSLNFDVTVMMGTQDISDMVDVRIDKKEDDRYGRRKQGMRL